MTFPRVVRSEWTKLTALRSTWILLALGTAATVGLAAATPHAAYTGVDVFSLLLGVFGILTITGEYGSGLIRATFAAVPRRLPVLWAKAVVLAGIALPVMLVACFAALPLSASPHSIRVALGAAVAPIGLALIGLGIGAVVRHTAAAITVYVLSMLLLPGIVSAAVPHGTAIARFVPVAAAQGLYATGNPFRMLAPGPSALVLAGWIVALLAAGAAVMDRRDP